MSKTIKVKISRSSTPARVRAVIDLRRGSASSPINRDKPRSTNKREALIDQEE